MLDKASLLREEGVSLCVGCLWSSLPSAVAGDCDTSRLAHLPGVRRLPLRHPEAQSTGGWGVVD